MTKNSLADRTRMRSYRGKKRPQKKLHTNLPGTDKMSNALTKAKSSSTVRKDPPRADYSDEVTFEQLARLQKLVKAPADDELEVVSGPAW